MTDNLRSTGRRSGTYRSGAKVAFLAAAFGLVLAWHATAGAQDLGSPPIVLQEPVPEAFVVFGRSVASGDVNGDGHADVIVGAQFSSVDTGTGSLEGAGEAFVFLGPDLTAAVTLQDPIPQANAYFGLSVASGDVNGDGYDDVIVGAANSDVDPSTGPLAEAGEAFVFLGPDLTTVIPLQDPMPEAGALFGWPVASGDVNGDGHDDVIVGAVSSTVNPGTGPLEYAGEAFVFLGPDLTGVISLQDPVPEVGAHFGISVASGDVNGDGYADTIVGARLSDVDPGTGLVGNAGEAFVFLGPDLTSVATLQDPVPEVGAHFGEAVASGDVNGDGYADVIVGADRSQVGPAANAGEAFLFLGPDLTYTATLQDPVLDFSDRFGTSVASGDVNGDGYAEVIVGAVFSNVDPGTGIVVSAGAAFVFLGPNLSGPVHLHDPVPVETNHFGNAVASGDVNGDGHADVIVGAYESDVDQGTGPLEAAGEVFVFLAGDDLDGDGLPNALDPYPLDPDSDGDGILDGSDPDTAAAVVAGLDLGVFANQGDPAGQRNAMLSRLEDVERAIESGNTAEALNMLRNLRRRVDGCPDTPMPGESAEANDWIVDCDAQREVRVLIDLLIANLTSP